MNQTAPPKIYLVRHGETTWTISGQHTGRTDIPLTERGERDAQELTARLRGMTFASVLTSALQRARRTGDLTGLGARPMTRLAFMPATNSACLTCSLPVRCRQHLASAATFAVGAALPILAVMLAPGARLVLAVSGASLICLAALGALDACAGGASAWIGAGRVAFWGALAMAATTGVGALLGTTVS